MRRLLVAFDFSEVTPRLLEQTQEIAQNFQSKVYLLHVASPDPDFVGYQTASPIRRDHIADHFREDHQKIQELGENLRSQGINATALLIQGVTVDKIIQEAKKLEISLIIMGSHHYNPLQKLFIPSVSEGVLKHAPCPVLIVP